MIIDSFDINSEPIVSLKSFYGEQNYICDICIITFSKFIFKKVLEEYNCIKIAEIGACNGDISIYSLMYKGKQVAFYLSPIGSTMASQCLIETNWLIGATKFVMFGSAGSLNKEKTTGKYVIPTEAYRDEGMSYHYAEPKDYIEIQYANEVKAIFNTANIPFVYGRIWTTDAICRETRDLFKKRVNEGCIAVEMELAGVQAVCTFHGWKLYNFLMTGDILDQSEYEVADLADANHSFSKFNLALMLAERV